MPKSRFRTAIQGPVFTLMLAVVLGGCGRNAGLVPVSGRVTLNGGNWPKGGTITFAPVKPADKCALVPAMASFDANGNFVARSSMGAGVMPGEYHVAVTCWEREPTDSTPGKNLAPERFANAGTSCLTLKVEPGSRSLMQNYDIPTK
jgi:hypothetical protein